MRRFQTSICDVINQLFHQNQEFMLPHVVATSSLTAAAPTLMPLTQSK